jgi:hypothetical protein
MLRVNFTGYNSYITDSLYQWDLNQEFSIQGLSVDVAPVIHFSNKCMSEAIVVQSKMNDNGVITCKVPNALLQFSCDITAHLCSSADQMCKAYETIVIPIIPRKKPVDYLYTDNVPILTYEAIEADIQTYYNKAVKYVNDRNVNTNSELKSEIDIERKRIDNIVALPNGSTTGDAELIDGRIDYTGKKWNTIGSHIRGVSNKIEKLIFKPSLTIQGYMQTNGEIAPNSYENSRTTDFIDISGYTTLEYLTHLSMGGISVAFYDKYLNLIHELSIINNDESWSASEVSGTIDLTDNIYTDVHYIRMSAYDSNKVWGEDVFSCKLYFDNSIYQKMQDFFQIKPSLTIQGYIQTNGEMTPETHLSYEESKTTDFIDISGYTTLEYFTHLNSTGISVAFYDKCHALIPELSIINKDAWSASKISGTVDLTDNVYSDVHYIRMSAYDSNYEWGEDVFSCKLYIDSVVESTRLLLKQNEAVNVYLSDKMINVMGDSITSIDYTRPTWWEIIAKNTGATFNNYGQSGTTLAHTNDRHLWDKSFSQETAEQLGYDPNDPNTWNTGNCFCERVDEMDATADAVIVMGGTNDNSVPRGAWDSTDSTTFFGALNILMKNVIETFSGKPIIFCTMMQRKDSYLSNVANPLDSLLSKADSDTLSLQLRAEAIKAKCKQYGLPCIDLYNESGINGTDSNGVYFRTNDATHPSAIGQNRIACLIHEKLETLFRY